MVIRTLPCNCLIAQARLVWCLTVSPALPRHACIDVKPRMIPYVLAPTLALHAWRHARGYSPAANAPPTHLPLTPPPPSHLFLRVDHRIRRALPASEDSD